MHRAIFFLAGIALSTGCIPAQQLSVSGPVDGFTFDLPTGSFRAVIGLIGSASLGPAMLDEGHRFDYGAVAPRQNYAIAFKGGQCLFVKGLGSDHLSISVLPGTHAADGAVWSSDGSVAILYSLQGNWIQSLAGFPRTVRPESSVDVSRLGGSLSAVATDVAGKRVAIGVAGEAGGVYLIADGQGFVPLLPRSKPIALAFSHNGGKLYAIDGATAQLSELRLDDLTSRLLPLHGLSHALAVKSARDTVDREVIYVASGKDRLLRAYDTSSQQVLANIRLSFQPTGIEEFGHNSFLLASRANDGDPLWFFRTGPRPVIYFVPEPPRLPEEDHK